MRVGLIGTGVVGARLARELSGAPGVDTVVLLGGNPRTRTRLAESLGPSVEARDDESSTTPSPLADLDTVVLCGPDEVQVDQARDALGAGCHVVSLADATASVDALFGLDDFAREVGRTVLVGATMSPGWSSVLARHASTLFDEVDEVSVAVTGSGGPACVERRNRAARSDTQEWREGAWVECTARSAPELVWFPEPLGAVDCARGDLSEAVLLRRLLPEVGQLVVKMGRPVSRPLPRRVRRLRRTPTTTPATDPGGVRVAVSGRADHQPLTVVYGLLCPAAEGSAVLAALAVDALVGGVPKAGVWGIAEVLDPVASLRSAARRGVRSMVYDGID